MRTRLAPLAVLYVLAAALIAPAALLAAESPTAQDQSTAPQPTEPQAAPPASAGVPGAESAESSPAPVAATPPAEAADEEDAAEEPARRADKEPVAFAAAPGAVIITDFKFTPASITVNVGDSVTWRNSGPTAHTATASDGSFDTGLLSRGESGSHTFTKAGTYPYICTPHPNMKGTVKVLAASSGGGGQDGGSGSGGGSSGNGSAGAGDSSADGGSGADLPATGVQAGLLAAFGVALLAAGLVGRRRI